MAPKKAPAGAMDEEVEEQWRELQKDEFDLKQRLMLQDRRVQESKQSEDALTERLQALHRGFREETEKAKEVTGEMSRQYREMRESFNERIEHLQGEVSQSKGEIEAVQREIDTTRAQKDEVLRKKDDEIRALTLKMETMAFEFADMLKETLDKMSQRIEVTHSSWDRDGGKPPLMNRLKQFALHEGDQA